MPTVYTFAEACKYLRISRCTLYRQLHKKSIVGSKVGGQWRFTQKNLDAVLSRESEVSSRQPIANYSRRTRHGPTERWA